VMPSISFIIGKYTQKVKNVEYIRQILNICKVEIENILKKYVEFRKHFVDILSNTGYNINIG
jgi:hypothetical protein